MAIQPYSHERSDCIQARDIRRDFTDNKNQALTRALSNVIETVQIFVDCINGIIDAWNTFYHTQISLFTLHARDKPDWPGILDRIIRSVSELVRLRNLLLTRRERFKFKLDSVCILLFISPYSINED
jgi:hypothetical protein